MLEKSWLGACWEVLQDAEFCVSCVDRTAGCRLHYSGHRHPTLMTTKRERESETLRWCLSDTPDTTRQHKAASSFPLRPRKGKGRGKGRKAETPKSSGRKQCREGRKEEGCVSYLLSIPQVPEVCAPCPAPCLPWPRERHR